MTQALLIGGPLHGQTRQVEPGDRIKIETAPAELSRLPFVGAVFETPAETATYVRCPAAEGVYVAEGYEPTPDDEQLVRDRLAG